MIVDYQIVAGEGLCFLIPKVKEEIAKGWQPVGGVTALKVDRSFMFYQAMTYSSPENKG